MGGFTALAFGLTIKSKTQRIVHLRKVLISTAYAQIIYRLRKNASVNILIFLQGQSSLIVWPQ